MSTHQLAAWMRPPGNRESFRRISEHLATAAIPAAPPARRRVVARRPVEGLLDLDVGGGQRLDAYLDASYTDALVVLRDGAVALEWLREGVGAEQRHICFSVSKSITALLAGALAGAGLLDVDAPVEVLVPEAAGSGFAGARVRDLLDMTVGLAFVEDYSPGPDVAAYRVAAGWAPAGPEGTTGLRPYLATRGRDGAHGTRFRYLSPITDMLGWVCERAAGVPYAEALATRLWGPLGATADAEITVAPDGGARAAGGICCVPLDLALVGQLVVERGAGVVPAAFVDDLVRNGDPAAWAAGDFADFLPGGAYRSCWYAPRAGGPVACAIGIHGQLIHADVERGVVVAKHSSWPAADDETGDGRAIQVAAAIGDALAG